MSPTPVATPVSPTLRRRRGMTEEAAIAAVDQVLRASGGRHYSHGSELERLSRDVRAGLYQPSDEESVQASYARALLGEIGTDR